MSSSTAISLCIPRVFDNITKERIFSIFKKLNLGFIESIDVVPKIKDNKKFNRVFIHFRNWNMKEHDDTYHKLNNGETIKIEYEEGKPWFWLVTKSNVARPEKKEEVKEDLGSKRVRSVNTTPKREMKRSTDTFVRNTDLMKTLEKQAGMIESLQKQLESLTVMSQQPEFPVLKREALVFPWKETVTSNVEPSSPPFSPQTPPRVHRILECPDAPIHPSFRGVIAKEANGEYSN